MNLEVSHKEGWLCGIAEEVLKRRKENGIVLSVAFPIARGAVQASTAGFDTEAGSKMRQELLRDGFCEKEVTWEGASFFCYGFLEDTSHPENYDPSLEQILPKIVYKVKPDIIHCFGTEYPHTLAMCKTFADKSRLLVGLQGICTLYAAGYFADLPEDVIRSVTFRDWLKKDTLIQQQRKFRLRGEMERDALLLAGNFTGRTEWDMSFAREWSASSCYYPMNETLRREFYGSVWDAKNCEIHSIFLSQGDYPLKGLHYMLAALPRILARYPDARVYVAGNSLVEFRTIKQKLKLSAYGRYLRRLLRRLKIQDKVEFLGRLDAEQMRDRYLKSGLFVCCSSLENSPNSLGEAMLLGMPCVSAAVGGIPSIFTGGEDGILYEGFEMPPEMECAEAGIQREDGQRTAAAESQRLEAVAGRLADAVIEMWSDDEKRKVYCANARAHALRTHDRESNYRRLTEIYEQILEGGNGIKLH